MAIFGNLSGRLEEDSPALRGLIRRMLGESSLSRLSEIYEFGFQLSGYPEEPVNRQIGASFNPKPARVCDLVSKEPLHQISETLLGAAILACGIEQYDQKTSFTEEEALARKALLLIKGEISADSLDANILSLALTLDFVRHLHMTNISTEAKDETIMNARNLLASVPDNLRLKTLLSTTITKYKTE